MTTTMEKIDRLIREGGEFMPRWGWHDDHKHVDRTPQYLVAMQQVRQEFADLLGVLQDCKVAGGRGLQLGIGEIQASHFVWAQVFPHMVTIDWRECFVTRDGETRLRPGQEIRSLEAFGFAEYHGPYDFLFIDAGHSFEDARHDHLDYGPLVRSGGIIAFHDALARTGFPEIEVWKYLASLGDAVHFIGDEVGVAWIQVP